MSDCLLRLAYLNVPCINIFCSFYGERVQKNTAKNGSYNDWIKVAANDHYTSWQSLSRGQCLNVFKDSRLNGTIVGVFSGV